MTSANVTHYEVKDKEGKRVGKYSQHCMCIQTIGEKLRKHVPYENFALTLIWPDEYEAPHYTQEMSLNDYLNGVKPVWLDEHGEPKIDPDEFVELQKKNQEILKTLYEVTPKCDHFKGCDKLAIFIDADWEGTSYYCTKHAGSHLTELPHLVKADTLLRGYKHDRS